MLISHLDDKKQDSIHNNSTNSSYRASPGSALDSSNKKKYKMTTINEDLLESQQNSTNKKGRNNDLKDIITDSDSAHK
jgi:hypothetical protein